MGSLRITSVEGKGGSISNYERTCCGTRAHPPHQAWWSHKWDAPGGAISRAQLPTRQHRSRALQGWTIRFLPNIVATDTSSETPTYLASVESGVSGAVVLVFHLWRHKITGTGDINLMTFVHMTAALSFLDLIARGCSIALCMMKLNIVYIYVVAGAAPAVAALGKISSSSTGGNGALCSSKGAGLHSVFKEPVYLGWRASSPRYRTEGSTAARNIAAALR